nr:MAG TPA: hypothetical protein [Caudoviricetes sp.]
MRLHSGYWPVHKYPSVIRYSCSLTPSSKNF